MASGAPSMWAAIAIISTSCRRSNRRRVNSPAIGANGASSAKIRYLARTLAMPVGVTSPRNPTGVRCLANDSFKLLYQRPAYCKTAPICFYLMV